MQLGKFFLYKAIGTIIVIGIVVSGFLLSKGTKEKVLPPQTFSYTGTTTPGNSFNNSRLGFSYVNSQGEPSTTTLVFDEMSLCGSYEQSIPCIAMSMSFDVAYNNRPVSVEGILTSNNEVLIRKLFSVAIATE